MLVRLRLPLVLLRDLVLVIIHHVVRRGFVTLFRLHGVHTNLWGATHLDILLHAWDTTAKWFNLFILVVKLFEIRVVL